VNARGIGATILPRFSASRAITAHDAANFCAECRIMRAVGRLRRKGPSADSATPGTIKLAKPNQAFTFGAEIVLQSADVASL
jgi:hypothetical protein